jgi:hypothetical protein
VGQRIDRQARLKKRANMFQLDGFRKYIHRGRAATPKVCIRKCGQIGFNSGAIQKYNLDDFSHVMLFIGDDKKRVAIRFTNNLKEGDLIQIQKRPGNFAFSAITFMRINDIKWDKTTNYEFKWIDRDKVAIFTPDKEGDTANADQ